MKIKIIILLLLILTIQGCDNQLDIEQNDSITSTTLYNSESGALAGLAGVYSRVVTAYKEAEINALYPSSYTDEGHYNRVGAFGYIKNDFSSSDTKLRILWTSYYEGIVSVNTFLIGVRNSDIDETLKQQLIAEGHFLRAFIYFDLEKAFGGKEGIPMQLEETIGELLPRTSGIDVYKQIIADLELAEKDLPEDADVTPGRAGKGVARGLLARAYLYIAGEPFNEPGAYEKSKEWSEAIISNSYYQLNSSYQDVFNKLAMEEYDNKEVLFQIGFSFANSDVNQSSKLGAVAGMLVHDEGCGKGFALMNVTISLLQKYRSDISDERGLWNVNPYYVPRLNDCNTALLNNQFLEVASKYRRSLESNNTNSSYGAHHWPVLRFSDVLLMYAEAENQINPGSSLALNAVNRVRNRAKATPFTEINEGLIQEERMLELCFEGHRKYDLLRWGILEERVNETKSIMETLGADSDFVNTDWSIYADANVGPDGIPLSGDEPTTLEVRLNSLSSSFNYFDGYNNFDISKHYILPIPEQELGVNTNLSQTAGW
ncbi:RagB/SusD family nutrient uptake outer membrane protein [Polaribacter undariae]|uniref:RagB/SusD family nutrient uptake outer membrane protein n=1 Tax=Polaribacter sejongensis TaxID=985043 RepID=A0AAJ1QWE8_9FLAO|nr:RagB/SusD family nutrient uptake outer membrane protein [Polaribacter undariae]MDN3619579.1 RagB/SusD family nutrient uptake outer membrane protein [Polaribacter undariae]UWD32307.1 RagB/SusD family nutrient uptake outer membrane protein [Polaribacter undariae]